MKTITEMTLCLNRCIFDYYSVFNVFIFASGHNGGIQSGQKANIYMIVTLIGLVCRHCTCKALAIYFLACLISSSVIFFPL